MGWRGRARGGLARRRLPFQAPDYGEPHSVRWRTMEVSQMRMYVLCLMLLLVPRQALGQGRGPYSRQAPAAAVPDKAAAPAGMDIWCGTVDQFARALSENDPGGLPSLLADGVTLSTFDGKSVEVLHLLARVHKGEMLMSRGYVHPAKTVASDISEELSNSSVPEELKRRMVLRDDQHARRANETAMRWLADVAGARTSDWVGVLMFWCERKVATEELPAAEVVFVLVRAETDARGNPGKIKHIAFGDAQSIGR